MSEQKRHVVVTTDSSRRGVFYGELVSEQMDSETGVVELENAKMAVYWCSDVKGVLGLAATGPLKGCKITPQIQKIKLNGVTAIMDCSDGAVKNWSKDTWN